MLSSMGGRSILGNVSTVILDEIHSIINSKRGTYLITAIDRLTALSGEFQRIALSATVRPLKTVAEFIGGFSVKGDPFDPMYQPRPVSIFQAADKKKYELSVQFPEEVAARYDQIRLRKQSVWEPIVRDIKKIADFPDGKRSTLPFAGNWHILDFPESTITLRMRRRKRPCEVACCERYGIL